MYHLYLNQPKQSNDLDVAKKFVLNTSRPHFFFCLSLLNFLYVEVWTILAMKNEIKGTLPCNGGDKLIINILQILAAGSYVGFKSNHWLPFAPFD